MKDLIVRLFFLQNLRMWDHTNSKWSSCTLFIHNRKRRHSSLHKNGEGVVKGRRLPDSGNVGEGPDRKILDLLSGERRLRNLLALNKFIRHIKKPKKNGPSRKSSTWGKLTNMWRNLRILLWVRICKTFPDSGSMTGSRWILCFSSE